MFSVLCQSQPPESGSLGNSHTGEWGTWRAWTMSLLLSFPQEKASVWRGEERSLNFLSVSIAFSAVFGLQSTALCPVLLSPPWCCCSPGHSCQSHLWHRNRERSGKTGEDSFCSLLHNTSTDHPLVSTSCLDLSSYGDYHRPQGQGGKQQRRNGKGMLAFVSPTLILKDSIDNQCWIQWFGQ
jgi:hypothetical protein